jgi:hypothetical protein
VFKILDKTGIFALRAGKDSGKKSCPGPGKERKAYNLGSALFLWKNAFDKEMFFFYNQSNPQGTRLAPLPKPFPPLKTDQGCSLPEQRFFLRQERQSVC